MVIGVTSTPWELQERIEEIKTQPRVSPPETGIFTGLGYELYNAPFRAVGKLVSPFLEDDQPLSKTDPNTMGIAAHLVEGLTDVVPYWAAAKATGSVLSWIPTPQTKILGMAMQALPYVAAAVYGGASKRKESAKEHQYQGVEKNTAYELGTYEAATFTGALALPVSLPLKSLVGRGLSGGAINIVAGAVDRGIASHVLERDGYHEMAEHYKILDAEGMILDGLIGTIFAFAHTKEGQAFAKKHTANMGTILSDIKDGISDRYIYRHAEVGSVKGTLKTAEAHEAHMSLHAETIEDLLAGREPRLDPEKMNKVAEGTIEDTRAPDMPLSETSLEKKTSYEPRYSEEVVDALGNAETLLKQLEEKNPQGAEVVKIDIKEHVEFNKMAKEKRLHEVLVNCFADLGGV